MTLQDFNSAILECLIYEENDEMALRFWKELGSPDSMSCGEKLNEFITIKHAISEDSLLSASEMLAQLKADNHQDFADLHYLLALAHLFCLIETNTDPLKIVEYARGSVVPMIDILGEQKAAERTSMLNMVMTQLVAGNSRPPSMNTDIPWAGDFQQLKRHIINDLRTRLFFPYDTEPPKLKRIAGMYLVLDHSFMRN